MAPLQITCSGHATIESPAELAVVSLTISSEGPSQAAVSEEVTRTASAVQSHLRVLARKDDESGERHADAAAAVAQWSMGSLATGSWQPVDSDGAALPRLFSATVRLEVHFRDFAELGSFAGNLAETRFVSISRIEWRLTEATRAQLGRQCRRNAVKDAMLKAKDYADAAGKADFAILEISDQSPGGGYAAAGSGRMMASFAPGDQEGQRLQFEPEEVAVGCEVVAKFDAA